MSAMLPWLPDARVLDLFAGSGALGLEALSRGAAHVTFVEIAGGPLKALRANIQRLGAAAECTVVRDDAMHYVRRLSREETAGRAFDIAVADPPYDEPHALALAELFIARPFADWLWVEHRTRDRMPEIPGARTRRYGDTAVTAIRALEAEVAPDVDDEDAVDFENEVDVDVGRSKEES